MIAKRHRSIEDKIGTNPTRLYKFKRRHIPTEKATSTHDSSLSNIVSSLGIYIYKNIHKKPI